jgi:hypothetical protein
MGIYVGDKRYAPYVGSKRRKAMTEKALPYDAEIEWLKGDGHAYLILPFVGHSDSTTFEVEFIVSNEVDSSLIGSRTSPNARFCWAIAPSGYDVQIGYDNFNSVKIHTTDGDAMIIKTTIEGNNLVYNITDVTTNTTRTFTYSLRQFTVLEYIYLFWSGTIYKSKSAIKRCVIKDNGITLIDCKSVRIGTTGYMYDKVSKQLFGNNGTGNFILGPDINN